MIKEMLKAQQIKEEKRILKVMQRFINVICQKEFGFKPLKYTTGRKDKGLYIYIKEDSKPIFLSLEKYKDNSIDDKQMESLVKNLLVSAI